MGPEAIPRMMPDAWPIFFRGRTLRPIQQTAIPYILGGGSVLISSPTASGKSEAAFAPLYQRHLSFGRTKLSTLYVAPTKALVNDMYSRLTEYFCERSVEVIRRYTGDHHEFNNPDNCFVLLATPEALDSLQITHPGNLKFLRAIICDELHLMHGAPRGQQLRHVISRIKGNLAKPRDERDTFQMLAMTATLEDEENVRQLWLGTESQIVNAGGSREIELSIHDATSGGADELSGLIRKSELKKFLIFANTRNEAHELVDALNSQLQGSSWPLFLHIGILSRAEREHVEHEMKYGIRGICVATSTLEVGIDIGDVEAVVLLRPPHSISSFLQRIGRGNRRSGTCRVWGLARNARERSLYAALLRCAERGVVDDSHEFQRLSVEFQQILSVVWAGVRDGDHLTRDEVIHRTGNSVSADTLLDMLATGVLREAGTALIPSDEWMDLGDERRIHSVIAGLGGLPLIDLESGETLAETDSLETQGRIFTGARIRITAGADESGIYARVAGRASETKLARLPTSRRGLVGLSRQLTWSMAELSGSNPRRWMQHGNRLFTWGGDFYNIIVAEALRVGKVAQAAQPHCDFIENVPPEANVTPATVRNLVSQLLKQGSVRLDVARKFRQSSKFFSHLSSELQKIETVRSVPLHGVLGWLDECVRFAAA